VCWLKFLLTLHLAALVRDPEKKTACVTLPAESTFPPPCLGAALPFTAQNLLKSHRVARQKALGSFGELRVVPFHGQDPPQSQSRVSHT